MALQDQRQDSLLRKRSAVAALLVVCAGAGLGAWYFSRAAAKNTFSREVDSVGIADDQRAAFTEKKPSIAHEVSADRVASKGFRQPSSASLPGLSPRLSPGFAPEVSPGEIYDHTRVQTRIAAVERGDQFGDDTPSERAARARLQQNTEQRAGKPVVAITGRYADVQVEQLTATLTLDPALMQRSEAVLTFPDHAAYRLTAPINGSGVMVDGSFIPPGASVIVSTGAHLTLHGSTDIYLAPAGPLRPPQGAG